LQVLIQECGELRFITIGIVGRGWNPHDLPGCQVNTVGYRVHEGKMFDMDNPNTGRYVKGSVVKFKLKI
jgi:hypothetical protein